MFRKYHIYFPLKLLFTLFIVNIVYSAQDSSTSVDKLDSLRLSIKVVQDSLSQIQVIQSELGRKFQQINIQIYNYKQNKNFNNPIKNYHLQNDLKKSQSMADQIENNTIIKKKLENKLQHLYNLAIQQIDREIQENLTKSKNAVDKKRGQVKGLLKIQNLEKEKTEYYNQLKTINIIVHDWKDLLLEPGDTSQRILTKIAILQDKLTSIEFIIEQQKRNLDELKKDLKVHQEMIGFYTDLKLAIEDEQEFFDRNHIEEIQDQIDEIDRKMKQINQEINEMEANADSLKNKIKTFQDAITIQ